MNPNPLTPEEQDELQALANADHFAPLSRADLARMRELEGREG